MHRGLIRLVALLLISFGLVAVEPAAIQAAEPAVTYQDQSFLGPPSSPASWSPTADKPQSKLFFGQGSWWAMMLDSDGRFRIHELMADHTWRVAGSVVDDRTNSTADVLYDGSRLYVASRQASTPLEVSRMSFQPTTRSWALDAGFPVSVDSSGSESASIEKDSTGRLWVTWTRSSSVWVSHTTTDDFTWVAGFRPRVEDTAVTADDLSGLISFGDKIGVLWSDQESGRFAFAVHRDGDSDSRWSSETALSGPSIVDDHLNLKNVGDDPSGRVYAVVKTSRDDGPAPPLSDPLVILLVREADGSWSRHTVATVGDHWTRAQLQVDTVQHRVLVFGTAPVTGGTIYYKSAPMADPEFSSGRGSPFVTYQGTHLNNATGTKQPLTQQTGVVIIACSTGTDSRYYHAEMPLNPLNPLTGPTPPDPPVVEPPTPVVDPVPPRAPTSVRATRRKGSATVTWIAPTSVGSSAIIGYRIRRYAGTTNAAQRTTTAAATARRFTATRLTNGSSYSFRVWAVSAAGRGPASARSNAVTPATTPRAPRMRAARSGRRGGLITATAAWWAPTFNGGSAIRGYRVRALRMSRTGKVLSRTVSARGPASVRRLSMRLPRRGRYRLTAEAVNAVGTGPRSPWSNRVAGR